jgi:hypothetical protein
MGTTLSLTTGIASESSVGRSGNNLPCRTSCTRLQASKRRYTACASEVPSAASTGKNEAVELRDGDRTRYGGKGVLKAVANVEQIIKPAVTGIDSEDQAGLDHKMIPIFDQMVDEGLIAISDVKIVRYVHQEGVWSQ